MEVPTVNFLKNLLKYVPNHFDSNLVKLHLPYLVLDLEDGVHLLKLAYFVFYQTQGAYKLNSPKNLT